MPGGMLAPVYAGGLGWLYWIRYAHTRIFSETSVTSLITTLFHTLNTPQTYPRTDTHARVHTHPHANSHTHTDMHAPTPTYVRAGMHMEVLVGSRVVGYTWECSCVYVGRRIYIIGYNPDYMDMHGYIYEWVHVDGLADDGTKVRVVARTNTHPHTLLHKIRL